jgi:hypothetical protein
MRRQKGDLENGQQGLLFFKNFSLSGVGLPGWHEPHLKIFLLLFFKKEALSSSQPATTTPFRPVRHFP